MINYFKDKKVLVTGGTGFIGRNVVKRLLDLEADVTFCGHKNTNRQLDLGDTNNPPVKLQRDFTEWSDCEETFGLNKKGKNRNQFDLVFHCAAVTHGAKFMNENPAGLVVDNTVMNTYLLDAAYKAGVKKFIFISSGAVYSGNDTCSEDSFLGKLPDVYFGVANMKRYGEKLCEFYSTKVKNPMQCLVVRPSNVYGHYDDFNPDTSHVMAALIKKFVEEQNPFEVWGDGKDIRDFIYIDDFIEDLFLLTARVTKFDIFNIAHGIGYSINELITLPVFYKIKKIKYLKGKPSTVKERLFDITKLNKFIGMGGRKRTSIECGIDKTMEWYDYVTFDINKAL